MSIKEILKRLGRPRVQPTTERPPAQPPPKIYHVRQLKEGGYEVTSSEFQGLVAIKTFGGWHLYDPDSFEDEGRSLEASDTDYLDSLVRSAQKK